MVKWIKTQRRQGFEHPKCHNADFVFGFHQYRHIFWGQSQVVLWIYQLIFVKSFHIWEKVSKFVRRWCICLFQSFAEQFSLLSFTTYNKTLAFSHLVKDIPILFMLEKKPRHSDVPGNRLDWHAESIIDTVV